MLVSVAACGHKKVQVAAPPTTSTPAAVPKSELEGLASYYAEPYHGRKTASGEIFDTYQNLTAAHRTLPFNTMVRVTNKINGRTVDVRINDRGPFVNGRVIDLSVRAARLINLMGPGLAPVRLTILTTVQVPASFAVQVAAFENPQTAEKLKHRLEKKYPSVTVQTFTEDKTWYRVRIAATDMDSANKTASELRKQDLKPFVVRLN